MFNENLKHWILAGNLHNDNLNNHLIVFDIELANLRESFNEYILKANWKRFREDDLDKDSLRYDYVIFDNNVKFTPVSLYQKIKDHNNKILVFDNQSILKRKDLREIIEGAVCSSPESATKWPVRASGQPDFIFNGIIILLLKISRYDFEKRNSIVIY